MRSTLGINLNLCFTKIKRPPSTESSSSSSSSSTTTLEDQSRPSPISTTTASSNLIKNFNSLFDSTSTSLTHFSDDPSLSSAAAATPDFAAVFASQRFFFSSPGLSNSIVDSSSSSSSSSSVKLPESEVIVGGGVAIPTISPNPFNDFRRSMQEMVEARDLVDVTANWDYLHELLMCYLALNPKSTHKFIVGAFADLLVTLMTSPPSKSAAGLESEFSGGGCSISRRCM